MLFLLKRPEVPIGTVVSQFLTSEESKSCQAVFKKHEEIFLPFERLAIPANMHAKLKLQFYQVASQQVILANHLQDLEPVLLKHAVYGPNYRLLLSFPGISAITAMVLVVEIGDFSRFCSKRAFIKYCGVTPQIYSSAEKELYGHLNRQSNSNLRWALLQVSLALGRLHSLPSALEYQVKRYKQKRKEGRRGGRIHLANVIAGYLYGIIKSGLPFQGDTSKLEAKRRAGSDESYLDSIRTRMLKAKIQNFIIDTSDFHNAAIRRDLRRLGHHLLAREAKSRLHCKAKR